MPNHEPGSPVLRKPPPEPRRYADPATLPKPIVPSIPRNFRWDRTSPNPNQGAIMIEYQITAEGEDYALAWATIEPARAGGFVVWFAPYGGWRGASGYEFYGLVDGMPYWRPSEESAREAAYAACLEWAAQAKDDARTECRIVESDGVYVVAEESVAA